MTIQVMKRLALIGILMVLLSVPAMAQEDVPLTLEHDGVERSYFLHVPEGYTDDSPVPLILQLHGAGMTGVMMQLTTNMQSMTDELGAIVVYPNGIGLGWNYLDQDQSGPGAPFTDDIGFLTALLDELTSTYLIDPDAIFVAGYSNGGMMVLRMRCEMPERFAGAVVIGATFSLALAEHCIDVDPVPLMMIIGTQDGAFPWAGSARFTEDGLLDVTFSMAQTMPFLRDMNHCDEEGDVSDVTPDDGNNQIIRQMYTNCQDDAQVMLYAIVDWTHDWPFRPHFILENGESGDVRALIAEFFGK